MDEAELIDLYEELVETLQSLNREAPEIKEMYENTKEDLERSLSVIQKTAAQEIDKIKKAGTAENDAIARLFSEQNKKMEELNQHLDQIKDSFDEQRNKFGDLEKKIITIEEKLDELCPTVEIDYEETAPAIELFDKYYGRIGRPVVLEKPNYTNDYCFRVSGIDEDNEVLTGRFYRQGRLYGNKSTFDFSTTCRMFNGSTLDDVIEGDI